ncbi:MAG: DNA adenine methylase [Spirochaetia bacterium]|jgi:adenine-specific DNA-methyltransferase|nr:DNA adenine methylase [Spirochaetia bacterium]
MKKRDDSADSAILENLLFPKTEDENPAYLTDQLITYIGNKRSLLDFIGNGLSHVKKRLNREKLSVFDVFSGSGIVSRYFKKHSDLLVVNDLEKYAEVISRCYLSNADEIDLSHLKKLYKYLLSELDNHPLQSGIISCNYAPMDSSKILKGERVFYTVRNAKYIDTARLLIDKIDEKYQHYFLSPLLSEASIHANTAGVFKGYYKCRKSGIGQFGGTNGDALSRITGDINLQFPVFSNFSCRTLILRGDAAVIADKAPEVDIAYLDPPYNQHPYGSNYFMLNLIADYKMPERISSVSGIPENWNRSSYNNKADSYNAFKELASKLKAKYLLISFNSEGFISLDVMVDMLEKIGKVTVLETKYNTFRGSRNLKNRDIHVKEFLYLVEKY